MVSFCENLMTLSETVFSHSQESKSKAWVLPKLPVTEFQQKKWVTRVLIGRSEVVTLSLSMGDSITV